MNIHIVSWYLFAHYVVPEAFGMFQQLIIFGNIWNGFPQFNSGIKRIKNQCESMSLIIRSECSSVFVISTRYSFTALTLPGSV